MLLMLRSKTQGYGGERRSSKKLGKLTTTVAVLLALSLAAAVPAIGQVTQESEQEGESGEVDQTFEVSGSGDNSNQCAGIQGDANTGSAQNVTDLLQDASTADEFEFEEVGSDVTVDGDSTTTCDQQVNQAAAASTSQPPSPEPPKGQPDLVPVNPTPQAGPFGFCRLEPDGGSFGAELVVTVANQGTAPAADSTVTVEFTPDLGGSPPFEGEAFQRRTGPIAAGSSVDLRFPLPEVRQRTPTDPGRNVFNPNAEFTITVDSGGEVTESNEGNNFAEGFCLG